MVNHGFNLWSPPATGCSATAPLHLRFLEYYGVDDTRGGGLVYRCFLLSLSSRGIPLTCEFYPGIASFESQLASIAPPIYNKWKSWLRLSLGLRGSISSSYALPECFGWQLVITRLRSRFELGNGLQALLFDYSCAFVSAF